MDKKVEEYLSLKIENERTPDEGAQSHEDCCVCADCVYSRMLNKPSHTMFNLTMRSVYRKSFQQKSPQQKQTQKQAAKSP